MYAFGIKHTVRLQDDETGVKMLTIKGTKYKYTAQRPQGVLYMCMLFAFQGLLSDTDSADAAHHIC